MIDIENFRRDEIMFNNEKDFLNEINKNKLTLRKKKINNQIQKKREYIILHNNKNNNIDKGLQFHITNFDSSYNTIENYLNSNNLDLISYCFREIDIYFSINCPNIKEQKKIIETKFLYTFIKFGNKFIIEKNLFDLETILRILINIQKIEEGNNKFTEDIYSNIFFDFFNNCLNLVKESDKEEKDKIYKQIISILNMMAFYHDDDIYDLNLIFLRSPVFKNILEYYQTNNSNNENDFKEFLKLITFTVNLSDSESSLCKDDKIILDNCLVILAKELYGGGNKEELLSLIYEGLFHLSLLEGEYDCCQKLIDEGVAVKILKLKSNKFKLTPDYLKIIRFSMRILANILTMTDKNCQVLYASNIIDFYNNILEKFDNDKNVVRAILYGIKNISIGSNYEIIKSCNIWQEKNIQLYLNYNDEIIIQYIKIIKYLLQKTNQEMIKFIYDSKILEYLMYSFMHLNIGQNCSFKILEIVDQYLCTFKTKLKESDEYLMIYNFLKGLFNCSEKVILLYNVKNIIPMIEKRIKENYE